ncbi:MAG TPA: GLUG motif-containing protein [Rhizomicrobium sp.]|jgi:hypothetical protein
MDRRAKVALFASAVSAILGAATNAYAALTISTAATNGVTCTSGVCKANSADAVLNVKDLTTLLGTTNVKIVAEKAQADIDITAAVIWATPHKLTLDAYHSINFAQPVTSEGTASGAKLITNDGGSGGDYVFSSTGNLSLWDLDSTLIINGRSYVLCKDLASLAKHIANKPSGFFALSRPYDASMDGVYAVAPVPTTFGGSFDGLGNRISNLSISGGASQLGLFAQTNGGQIRDVTFAKTKVTGSGSADVGMLVGLNQGGTILYASAAGAVSGGGRGSVGGLVGYNSAGTIGESSSSATVTDTVAGAGFFSQAVGGLVGVNVDGTITSSFATGNVTGGLLCETGGLVGYSKTLNGTATISRSYATGSVTGGDENDIGGLAGSSWSFSGTASIVANSYATGTVTGGSGGSQGMNVGGLVGYNGTSSVSQSYATGAVSGGGHANIGGLIGYDDSAGTASKVFATGPVTAGSNSFGGGLTGSINGVVSDAYALGAVTGAPQSDIGGFTGQNNTSGNIDRAYSTGLLQGADGSVIIGGFIGLNSDSVPVAVQDAYFDTQTSKQSAGVGSGETTGTTGLTTSALKFKLPTGFDSTVWAQKATINSGFPYLLTNKPPA